MGVAGLFKVRQTFEKASQSQSGQPPIGAGAQTTGEPSFVSKGANQETRWAPDRPTKGVFSWLLGRKKPSDSQIGFPDPYDPAQARPAGQMDNYPSPVSGLPQMVYTPYFDRGAAAYVPNYGKVLYNPVGAGVVALHRPKAFYGGAAQYIDHALWWTSQVIPTSLNTQGLTDPEGLSEILDSITVQAVYPTT